MALRSKKPKRSTLKARADQMFRDLVRARGYCELSSVYDHQCGGRLETMHIVPRRNHRLRWEPLNALCGCSVVHGYFTQHDRHWWKVIEEHFPAQYAFVAAHENEMWNKDYDEVLESLKAALAAEVSS